MANKVERKNSVFFKTVIGSTLITIALMSTIFWRVKHPEEPHYYQMQIVQGQKQFISLGAMNHRIFSRQALLLWIEEVVGNIYTFNGISYQQKFNAILSNDFSSDGADSFRKTLEDSQLLKQVITQQLNLTGIVGGQPVILEQGPLLGKYSWKVQMPVLLTFESASQITTKRIIVTVLVVGVETQDSPYEVAINDFWSVSG